MCMELCFSRAKFCSPTYTHSVASIITAAPCSGLLVNAVSLCCPFPCHICHQAPCLLSTQQSLHQHPPLTNIPSFCLFPLKALLWPSACPSSSVPSQWCFLSPFPSQEKGTLPSASTAPCCHWDSRRQSHCLLSEQFPSHLPATSPPPSLIFCHFMEPTPLCPAKRMHLYKVNG